MIAPRPAQCFGFPPPSGWWAGLAAACMALAAAQADELVLPGWSASRQQAPVAPSDEWLSQDTIAGISPSLLARRPARLGRPAPGVARPVWAGEWDSSVLTGEPLPNVPGRSPALGDASQGTVQPGMPAEMGEPDVYYDGGYAAGPPTMHGPLPPGIVCGDSGCAACGAGGWGGWGACVWIPICVFIPRPPLEGLELVSGVQGFTGPANRGGAASFGFHEGFNWGMPVAGCMAFQWGALWTQSSFDGSDLTRDGRNQIFVTGGLFRRVDWGLQGGLVVDYLHDEWDYSADLVQLRGELSWLWCGRNELGFWFTAGVNDAANLLVRQHVVSQQGSVITYDTAPATLAVHDLYAFFFRRQFACGGQGRLFGGFTGEGQGLFGGDAQLPLAPRWSLSSSFLYVAPRGEDTFSDPRYARESWNLSISLVWTPFAPVGCGTSYARPLFPVADNGSFVTRLTTP